MPDGKVPDHFATLSQNPSQPFGGMYEIKFVFPRAEIPSEIANLLFPATLIFFSDRKFLFSNHCQVVRKKGISSVHFPEQHFSVKTSFSYFGHN